VFDDEVVWYIDVSLDLWVSVDGKQTVLDENEFDELNLSDDLRAGALQGLSELQQLFETKNPPLSYWRIFCGC
jgi:protein associated with RNAse G/E